MVFEKMHQLGTGYPLSSHASERTNIKREKTNLGEIQEKMKNDNVGEFD